MLVLVLLACRAPAEGPSAPPPADSAPSSTASTGMGDTSATAATGPTGAPGSTALSGDTGTTGATAGTADSSAWCTDPYDPNDTVADAVPLPADTELHTADTVPDWFTVTVEPGARATLTVEPTSVEMVVTDDQGVAVGYERYVHALYNTSDQPVAFPVQIVPPDKGTCHRYRVAREDTPDLVEVCTDDAVADDVAQATPLERRGNYWFASDTVFTGDIDWYQVPLRAGQTPTLQVYGVDDGARVDVYADPAQPPVLSHWGGYSYDYVELRFRDPVPANAIYSIRVEYVGGYGGCPELDVSVW